jgi:hypothetical protein
MPQAKEITIDAVAVDLTHFDMMPNGIEVSDPHVAAALTCRSQFWGNVGEARQRGPHEEYPPAKLISLDVRWKPQDQLLCVIFMLKGEPADLRVRRVRFHSGELYIPDKKEWRKQFALVNDIIAENREKAFNKLKELIAGGAL